MREGPGRCLLSWSVAVARIRNRTWVASQLDAGATVTALAREAGVSRQTAQAWLVRHGLFECHGRRKRGAPASRLRSLYKRHGSLVAVARVLDVAPSTAHRWLIDIGIQLRVPGGARRLTDSAELAELDRREQSARPRRSWLITSASRSRPCAGDSQSPEPL